MKKTLVIALIFFNLKAAAQDMIYHADGYMVPGKILEITKDSVRFENLANPDGPDYNYPVINIQFAFNSTGNYLVFNPALPFSEKERHEFMARVAKPRPLDIVVDLTGKLSALTITNETENEISGIDNGKDVKYSKDSLYFIIRKNGHHELFSSVDKALPYFVNYKLKIDSLLAYAPATLIPGPIEDPNYYVVPDMESFGRLAFARIQEFTNYLQNIISVNSTQAAAAKSRDLACDLFLNSGKNSYIEVSSIKTAGKKKYLMRDYLNTMMTKAGKFDRMDIEYADFDYASKFRRGPDGNYYGTVTFVQKLQGFTDGNVVYRERTKRNIVFALPHENGKSNEPVFWKVYLDDIGIVETEKL